MALVDVYIQVVADRFGVTPDRIRAYAERQVRMTDVTLYQALDFLVALQASSGLPPEATVWVLDTMEDIFNERG